MTKKARPKKHLFTRIAGGASKLTGSPPASIIAFSTVLVWAISGPVFDYSDTWQLVINTGTTIVTFLMVFLIQNSQNRDTEALHIKLDELIRTTKGAHNVLMDLEELSEDELDEIRDKYEEIAARSRDVLKKGKSDTATPKIEIAVKEKNCST